jgi:hypothetical protein
VIRTFKYVSLTSGGSPQPCFGTTLTAAVSPGSQVSVPVTDSSFFQKGDPVNFDVGANEERTSVYSVPDSTHIVVANLTLAHANGTFVRLSGSISNVYIQCKPANSGIVYIGNKNTMVKATGVSCISILQPFGAAIQPIEFSSAVAGFQGGLSFGELWWDGTTGDNILPSADID